MTTIPRLNVDDKPPAPVKAADVVKSYTTHEPATSRMFPAVLVVMTGVGMLGLLAASMFGGN